MSSNFDKKKSSGQEVWIFDAKNVAKGPICRLASKDLDLAYTLHSSWMEEVKLRDPNLYKLDLVSDSSNLLAKQDENITSVFTSIIKQNFDRS